MRKWIIPLLLGTLLSACQAPLPSTPAARQEEGSRALPIESSRVTKLVAPGTLVSELWQVMLSETTSMITFPTNYTITSNSYLNGKGIFTPLGLMNGMFRFSYTVPPDRVLHIASSYSVNIDGIAPYGGRVGTYFYEPTTIDKVYFGPGQTLIFSTPWGVTNIYGGYAQGSLQGFTVNADAFMSTGGAGGVLGVK